jgi:IS30 family transposase
MDTVGSSRVRSMVGKWYVIVIVDDYSRYSWVFFLESKDEVFEHFQNLALRLNNEHPNCLKAIRSANGTEFRNASVLIISSPPRVFLNRMESWNKRTAH